MTLPASHPFFVSSLRDVEVITDSHDSEKVTPPISYRADIDGLRAVAVVAVVLFHAFPKRFTSGFMGVDVFFVISGFLISSIIFADLKTRKFSFVDFYRRRVLRIFPALFTVLASVLVFSWFTLVSDEFRLLGKHLVGAATFTSNFFLLDESGYFDLSSELKPLLHLWSLSIEEQFYLLYPLFLWFCYRKGFGLRGPILALGLVSFGVNMFLAFREPYADFYLPFSRFWELMSGAYVAYLRFGASSEASKRNSVIFLLGALLLGVGFFIIRDGATFPGFWALFPVIGTSLMIHSGGGTRFSAPLSRGVILWLGKLSYPIYLWHWPLLSLARIIEGDSPNTYFRSAIVLLSVFLSWVTARFIEEPLRFGSGKARKSWFLLLMISGIGLAGGVIYLRSGVPSRDPKIQTVIHEGEMDHVSFHKYHVDHYYPCTPESIFQDSEKYDGLPRCFQSKPTGPIQLAILGDSHAEQLFHGLALILPETNVGYYLKPSLPVIGNARFSKIFEEVFRNSEIKTVIINSYWRSKGFQAKDFIPTISKLVAAGKEVYIFDDIPDYGFDPHRCKFRRRFRTEVSCDRNWSDFEKDQVRVREQMMELKSAVPAIGLVKSFDYFCRNGICSMLDSRQVLYRDYNHLNLEGSRYLLDRVLSDHPGIRR